MSKKKAILPRWEFYYGQSTSAQCHALKFSTPDGLFWFSYDTLVAFRINGTEKEDNGGLVVRENKWGPTTGKHLNAINDNKYCRVDSKTFARLFKKYTGQELSDYSD